MSMWKRTDGLDNTPEHPNQDPAPAPAPRPSTQYASPRAGNPGGAGKAVIGPSIRIQGDLSGEEDLFVQGRVDGKIDLKRHNVTIGESGRVKADVYAHAISVEGEVKGNLFAAEQVTVRQSGHVLGNITAPRVSLEDGAQFKGSIDMEPKRDAGGGQQSSGQQSGGKQSGGKPASGGSPASAHSAGAQSAAAQSAASTSADGGASSAQAGGAKATSSGAGSGNPDAAAQPKVAKGSD